MLTCTDVKFIFDSLRLGLSSSANILQNSICHPPSCLLAVLLCFKPLFRLVPAVVLTLKTCEVSAILVFTTKTTQWCINL